MSTQRVFVDASPLFSRTTRDWLFHARQVTRGQMFTIATSEDIIAETVARLRDEHPEWNGSRTGGLRGVIVDVFDTVVVEFDGSLPFPGKDQGDQHVHAAAVAMNATMLLTDDRGFHDLPEEDADLLPYEPFTPDDFFILLDDSQPKFVREMTQRQINFWVNRGVAPNLEQHLRKAGCPQFAARVASHIADLGGKSARRRYDALAAPTTTTS